MGRWITIVIITINSTCLAKWDTDFYRRSQQNNDCFTFLRMMNMSKEIFGITMLISLSIMVLGCKKEPIADESVFTDPRDGQTYRWVEIGDQVWMAENLRYLPSIIEPGVSESCMDPFYRRYTYNYFGNDVDEAKALNNFKNYGVLYNWPAAMNGVSSSSLNPSGVQGACPPGWHVPSDAEWTQLVDYLTSQGFPNDDVINGSGNALKSCRQHDSPLGGNCNTNEHPVWSSNDTNHGFDEFGFAAYPGGYCYLDGMFYFLGNSGFWWSATDDSSGIAWYRSVKYDSGSIIRYATNCSTCFSVRCLKDVD